MNESNAFRVKRAQDNVLRLAREWSKANKAWFDAPSITDEDQQKEDALHTKQRLLIKRLEAACHELVAVEGET